MMLRSLAREFHSLPRSLSQALICSAGVALSGCGSRFLEGPTALTRSPAAAAIEDDAKPDRVDDPPSEERSGARDFLTSLFRRDRKPGDWSRDPFLDTPVFAHAETREESEGVTPIPAGESATASAAPLRPNQILRPARRQSAEPQAAIDEAIARYAGANLPAREPGAATGDFPEWATGSNGDVARPLAQDMGPHESLPADSATSSEADGRVLISRIGTETLPAERVETAPTPSRRLDAMLAETAPVAADPTVASAGVWPETVSDQPRDMPDWMYTAPAPQPVAVHQPAPPERERENPFDNVVVATHAAASAAARTHVGTALSSARARTFPEATHENRPTAPVIDDSPWPDSPSVVGHFPVLNEWRGVRATSPVALADTESPQIASNDMAGVRQTVFEGHPGPERPAFPQAGPTVLSEGLAMAEQDRVTLFRGQFHAPPVPAAANVSVPAPPPLDVNPGIRVISNTPAPEESGSRLGYFVVLLIATAVGILVYRRRLEQQDS